MQYTDEESRLAWDFVIPRGILNLNNCTFYYGAVRSHDLQDS